jgi:50S ribosomal protein L16 3-hydroxylase
MIKTLLGGLTPQQFLRDYWQKKPLLVRNAIPGFEGLLSKKAACELACDEDVESRLVFQHKGDWQMQCGPMRKKDFTRKGAWTALVQGLNLHLPEADRLLREFAFIPYARLDDLMVSYATDGGGVGPHFDSYDVFLLQGLGQRRWEISAQSDLSLIEDAPLKILRKFTPSEEWVLNPGDMLYLPPRYAHNGTAIGECMTYSIGFRAPSAQELAVGFLGWLEENIDLPGMYSDPGLRATNNPARIPGDMVKQVGEILKKVSWNARDVEQFLGQHLSEPKAHVFFDPPENPLSAKQFRRHVEKVGLRLDARSHFFYSRHEIHVNGEAWPCVDDALRSMADRRELGSTHGLSDSAREMLYEWYCAGYLHLA